MQTKRECNWCGENDLSKLKVCSGCRLVDYCSTPCQQECWKAGHKILCSRVPKDVQKAKARIHSFSLDQYTIENIGTFWVTESEAARGQIVEERQAQDMCYDAWEMDDGSTEKLKLVLATLKHFPLSVDGWGNLGHFYQCEIKSHKIKVKECAAEALKMYETAIECARILNPTWTATRTEELPWGEIDNRPYLRVIKGRALALKDAGFIQEAVKQAEKLLRWNPSDNQGIRKIICSWYLEANDTEGCSNLLRKYNTAIDTYLAYTDLLLQFLRWKKDDAVEKDVQQALYKALQNNMYVPDLLLAENTKIVSHDAISPGGKDEAESYAQNVKSLWKTYPEFLTWLKAQKFTNGQNFPKEMDLIQLLRSGVTLLVSCVHTNLEGKNKKESAMICTQKKKKCRGCALDDFVWPRQLNREHQESSDILLHNNGWDREVSETIRWRKTTYSKIIAVPFWSILLRFQGEEECAAESASDSENELEIDKDVMKETMSKIKQQMTLDSVSSTKCKHCNSVPTICALADDGCNFYCSDSCMNQDFDDSHPDHLRFDLNSRILKIRPTDDNSLQKLDINLILSMATKFMPNVMAVDIYIPQSYVLSDPYYCDTDNKRSLTLTFSALLEFLIKKHSILEAFSLNLEECIHNDIAEMIDGGKALLPVGNMPKLSKFELSNFKFNDITVLTSCLNPNLKVLDIGYIRLGSGSWCKSDCKALVQKISEIKNLVTLELSDNHLSDDDLHHMLPRLKYLRCLDVSGRWRGENPCLLTERGLKCIAKYCTKIQSLNIGYQPRATSSGMKAIVEQCPHLLQLEAMDVGVATKDMRAILLTSKKLFHFRVGFIPDNEICLLEDVVRTTYGRIVISSSCTGVYKFNLPSGMKKIQESLTKKITNAWEKRREATVYNRWDEIDS